jgi:hypothetical protein
LHLQTSNQSPNTFQSGILLDMIIPFLWALFSTLRLVVGKLSVLRLIRLPTRGINLAAIATSRQDLLLYYGGTVDIPRISPLGFSTVCLNSPIVN